MFEALGGAVSGAIVGWWAIAWIVSGFVFVWMGATARAPFRQRDEARLEVERQRFHIRNLSSPPKENAPAWLNLTEAARLYRDELDKFPDLEMAAAIHDFWGKEEDIEPDVSYSKRFLFEVIEGVNHADKIKVRGRPTNGSKVVELPKPLSENDNSLKIINQLMLRGADGREYCELEVQRTSIMEYIQFQQEEHEAEKLKTLQQARKDGKIEDFIKEHEADPEGDLDKLDEAVKRPSRGSGKATPKASSQGASDD